MAESDVRRMVVEQMNTKLEAMALEAFTASSAPVDEEPLTMDALLAAIRDIGPPAPRMQFSKHATKLPSGKPHTYDMQMLVERLGQQRVPAAFRLDGYDGEVVVIHPDLMSATRP